MMIDQYGEDAPTAADAELVAADAAAARLPGPRAEGRAVAQAAAPALALAGARLSGRRPHFP